jgi:hypothetical protein
MTVAIIAIAGIIGLALVLRGLQFALERHRLARGKPTPIASLRLGQSEPV